MLEKPAQHRFGIHLYLSLICLMAMPTLFESVRVHLIHAEARQTIQIAAQIEWFDLIDETLAAFFFTL